MPFTTSLHGCWHLTGLLFISPSSASSSSLVHLFKEPVTMLRQLAQQRLYCKCHSPNPTPSISPPPLPSLTDESVSHVLWVGDTGAGSRGLSWLSLPVAIVTDVLFNTRAGSGSGWSEYKLAQWLQRGERGANVETKCCTWKPIPLQLCLMGHLRSSCYFHMLLIPHDPKETD